MTALSYLLLLVCCIVPASVSASERLIYAVTSNSTAPPTTEIFAIAPEDAHPTRIFSDASSPVLFGFAPQDVTGAPFQTAVAGNRLFAPGKERSAIGGARATGIYEFSLDGAGRSRKILDLPAGERVDILMVDGAAAKLAYLSLSASGLSLFIHEVKSGALLHHVDMTKIAGGCNVRTAGWLPDGQSLFFTLDEGAEGFMSDLDYKHIGTWTMREDGTSLRQLPVALGKVQEPGYRGAGPTILGIADAQYIFVTRGYITAKDASIRNFITRANPESIKSTSVELRQSSGMAEFVLARSGRYVAYVARDRSKFVGKTLEVPPEHVWIQPLPSGDPKEMFSIETRSAHAVALTIMGWTNE